MSDGAFDKWWKATVQFDNGEAIIGVLGLITLLFFVKSSPPVTDPGERDGNKEIDYMARGSPLASQKVNTNQTMLNAEAAYAMYYGNTTKLAAAIANLDPSFTLAEKISTITPGALEYYTWRNYDPADWTKVASTSQGAALIAKNIDNRNYANCLAQFGPADLIGVCRRAQPTADARPVLQ